MRWVGWRWIGSRIALVFFFPSVVFVDSRFVVGLRAALCCATSQMPISTSGRAGSLGWEIKDYRPPGFLVRIGRSRFSFPYCVMMAPRCSGLASLLWMGIEIID